MPQYATKLDLDAEITKLRGLVLETNGSQFGPPSMLTSQKSFSINKDVGNLDDFEVSSTSSSAILG